MVDFIKWLLFISFLGWLVFPIIFHYFNKSVERGFSITKIFGLLLWGYVYWIGNSFRLIPNNQLGAIFTLNLLFLISLWFFQKNKHKITDWLKNNLKIIVFYEIVYLLSFLAWIIVRAANPEIIGTEKPMELAFINGIHQSPNFPPHDPWLSGFAISYYYFGYLMVSNLMLLFGTSSGVAFNLAIALWFSLIFVGSAGIILNLIYKKIINPTNKQDSRRKIIQPLLSSLITPFFILIVSNLVGYFEMLHARGVFWNLDAQGNQHSIFWKWLDIYELNQPPSLISSWIPNRQGGTWWWRASRVLQDYTLTGQSREIIDEFPFFTFLLADLHPHLLAMPFVLMAIYICVYLFVLDTKIIDRFFQNKQILFDPFFSLFALVFGSLIFINTWDFPIYFFLFMFCLFIARSNQNIKFIECLKQTFTIFLKFGGLCLFLYIPFLLSLSSQAGGFLPSLIFKTRAVHYLVMFFPFLIILVVYLSQNWNRVFSQQLLKNFLIIIFVVIILLLLSLVYTYIVAGSGEIFNRLFGALGFEPFVTNALKDQTQRAFLNIYGANSITELVAETIRQYASYPGLNIFLVFLISISLTVIFFKYHSVKTSSAQFSREEILVFILLFLAAVLSLVPEFFYLKDQFGWRMNTIFKFYFQVWILLSIVCSYFMITIIFHKQKSKKIFGLLIITPSILMSLVYPLFALRSKTNDFKNIDLRLDGNLYLEEFYPLEYAGIMFVNQLPYGVIAEAVGGSYTNYGRVSRITGYPTVLGWPGHEIQWRGGMEEIGNREEEIKILYSSNNWDQASEIIAKYNIDYIFISDLERISYNLREEKFINNLHLVFQNEGVKIFSVNPKI